MLGSTSSSQGSIGYPGTGFVGAASPDDAVRLAVSGTITLGGLSWLPNPPDTFVFPRDLTANAANGNWQKFRFAADSYNSNTSSWTVTLQFIDDDCRDPWRADFDGSWCEVTVFAGPPRLSLTATDAADGNNHVTAITEPNSNLATIKDLYVAADSSGAGHIDLSALFGPSTLGGNATGQYLHVSISPSSDPTIDDTYSNLLTAGDLDDIALQTTPTVHDFVITAWLDADRDSQYDEGVDPTREIDVHVVTLGTLTVWDHDNSTDMVTTSDATVPELDLGQGSNGRVHISFSATTDLPEDPAAERLVHWVLVDQQGRTIQRGAGSSGDADYAAAEGSAATLTVFLGPPNAVFCGTTAAKREAAPTVRKPEWSATTMEKDHTTAASNLIDGKAGYNAWFTSTFGGNLPAGEGLGGRTQVWQKNVVTHEALCVDRTEAHDVNWKDLEDSVTYADVMDIPGDKQKAPFTFNDKSAVWPPDHDNPYTNVGETLLLYGSKVKTVGFNPPGDSLRVTDPPFRKADAVDKQKLAKMTDPHEQARTSYVFVNRARIEALRGQGKISESMYNKVKNIVKNMSGRDWTAVPDVFEYLKCVSDGKTFATLQFPEAPNP